MQCQQFSFREVLRKSFRQFLQLKICEKDFYLNLVNNLKMHTGYITFMQKQSGKLKLHNGC